MNQPRATLAAGMQVTPSVRLVSPLGAGGMGAVWLADHTGLNTRVVVKFMLDELDASTTARARFKREAEAASQVKSPHVVQTFDYGVTPEGVAFIVMEHLEGRDLGAELAARGPLGPATIVTIVTQVAKALGKAHAAGLLHRDIKPDNIFLCHGDSEDELFVKLLDFGIAKAPPVEGESTLDGQTKTGQVVGTPFYMSPEQVTAQKDIDHRSDLWSLGVVTFEALTGKRPYDGPSFGALAVKIATGETPRPSLLNEALPKSVDAWFAQACAREPDKRFGSARELASQLRASFEGLVSLPPIGSGMSDSGPRDSASGPGRKVVSAPPGPISVDEDGDGRPSFVLASTVTPATTPSPTPERSELARSEGGAAVAIAGVDTMPGGRRPARRLLGASFAIVVIGTTLGFALGRKEPPTTDVGGSTTSSKRLSAIPSTTGELAVSPSSSAVLSTTSSAPSPSAIADASVAETSHAPSASSLRSIAPTTPVRPPASASARPVPPIPSASARPVTTTTQDPLY